MNTSYCNLTCCPAKGDADKLEVTLSFSRNELLYDIKNYAFVEGHVMKGEEGNEHAQHLLVDIGEEGNVDRVNRVLETVHAAVTELLYPYTKCELEDGFVATNKLRTEHDYIIDMIVPKTFSSTTVMLLVRLIHEYMVYSVLSDWLSVTNAKAAGNWRDKALEAEKEIKSVKNMRREPIVRPMSHF